MQNTIHWAREWVRTVLAALATTTGRRRAQCADLPAVAVALPGPPPLVSLAPLPRHRSPYGVHGLLDGEDTVLVRPYVAAYEHRAAS
ncbi:hypothetical protein [Streptomyces gobiensis]|uniref:hypothetical protein n=1 Tax=Streptomyces gobiensis TaxID=2875706 RepID=UPI001E34FE8C|nr:hypothetical protein [Streptomyces gobiensis]UGY93140.1 hypothetical protein test1122_16425 [Streptomyces gobiensis]